MVAVALVKRCLICRFRVGTQKQGQSGLGLGPGTRIKTQDGITQGDSSWYHDSSADTAMDRAGSGHLIKDGPLVRVYTLVVSRLDRQGRSVGNSSVK
jgi:hypothetical protein